MAGPRSPLKDSPLRNPGQSLDEEIQRLIDDQVTAPFMGITGLWAVALIEWLAVLRNLPRQPWLFTVSALIGTAWLALRVIRMRRKVRDLRMGRDGERAVGQFLEGLREDGARIFHDVPAEGFNLDHVVISAGGICVVETKAITKPNPNAKVVYDGDRVTVAGRAPDRDPVAQAAAEATWLKRLLEQSTGRAFPVRGVVAYPRWWVEQVNTDRPRKVWVLEPKALPKFIEHAPQLISPDDVAMAAYHLSRYVQGETRSKE